MLKLLFILCFFVCLFGATDQEKINSIKSEHPNHIQNSNALPRWKRSSANWRYDIELPNPISTRGRQFRNSTITWRISQYPSFSFFNLANFTAVIRKAIAAWSDHAIIDFHELTDEGGRTDIDIQLMESNFDVSCGKMFIRYTMAHTDHDPARIHFNGAVPWSSDNESGFDLFTVAMHEIGHALGLNHTNKNNTVMSENYSGKLSGLTDKDIKAVQALYGARRSSTFAPTKIQSTPNLVTTTALVPGQATLCTPGRLYCRTQLISMGYKQTKTCGDHDLYLYKCNQNREAVFSLHCVGGCITSAGNSRCSCLAGTKYCGYELRPMSPMKYLLVQTIKTYVSGKMTQRLNYCKYVHMDA